MTLNLDIINACVPGYQGLQQIRIDAQGLIQAIEPMGEAIHELPLIDVAGIGCRWGVLICRLMGGLAWRSLM
jgi:N-acetylglucosamine-6-phosphate deacetylase